MNALALDSRRFLLLIPGHATTQILNPFAGMPGWFDGIAIFAALAGTFILQLRHPIRGSEPLQAVASNVLGFVYVAFLFNFAARIVFLVPGPGQVPGAMVLLWMIAVTKFSDMPDLSSAGALFAIRLE